MSYSVNQIDALRTSFREHFEVNHITLDMMNMLDDFGLNTLNDYIVGQFYNYFEPKEIKAIFEKYLSGDELDQIVSDISEGYPKSIEEDQEAEM